MKRIPLLVALGLSACHGGTENDKTAEHPMDSIDLAPAPSYSNARFRDVTVEEVGDHKFTIRGKAQVFEAAFAWVVEDGHNELQEGFEMTDAGAPEWGEFNFTIEVQKQRPNSTLTLILFESSPKDGSRQYELPIVLE